MLQQNRTDRQKTLPRLLPVCLFCMLWNGQPMVPGTAAWDPTPEDIRKESQQEPAQSYQSGKHWEWNNYKSHSQNLWDTSSQVDACYLQPRSELSRRHFLKTQQVNHMTPVSVSLSCCLKLQFGFWSSSWGSHKCRFIFPSSKER